MMTNLDDLAMSPLPLYGWHGSPISLPQARRWLDETRRRRQAGYRRGEHYFEDGAREVIARYWLELPIELQYLDARATAAAPREHALIELVYGQLLISRRLAGAMEHLDAGLDLGRELLATPTYFRVTRRHDLLRHLSLFGAPRSPEDLPALLVEAAVIERLERTVRRSPAVAGDRRDTLG